ncbi:MAG: C45 family autoproteolytic acyltransferase/hydrolase, partial [Planctomycetota bacterium]
MSRRLARSALAAALFICLPSCFAPAADTAPATDARAPEAAAPGTLASTPRYTEGRSGPAELRYIEGIPILSVMGTPQEMGRQKGILIAEQVRGISDYPKRLLKYIGREDQWPKMVAMAELLAPQFPVDMADELRAFAAETDVPRDIGLVGNTLADTMRGSFACSSLMIEPARSATGEAIFGRNLDYYAMGILDKYSLVIVYHPTGKHAFASIGFPGLVGCFSGMNDAGLAVAVHEVFVSHDGASLFNAKGVPYAMAFRRILEECGSVEEAARLMDSIPRTTMLNLAVCDPKRAGVIEMTPKSVVFRGSEQGICACTNHFRSEKLAVMSLCRRYDTLAETQSHSKLGV